ncbi:hypothetical protein QSV04_09300, partial [Bifidobacterium longum]|uniref:hypothetical protein n=1 Tax=Bifidobacterium longum TaxID=216816 RepID=UPI0025705600
AQFLPDPIGYTRHLARSHTTIVATQQLQYKSKSQPWSNRAFFLDIATNRKTGIFNRISVNNNIKIYRGIYATRKLLPSRKLYKPGQ